MRSDNITGVSPSVMEAIIRENEGEAAPYGRDDITEKSQQCLRDFFEDERLSAFNLVSGTAANALIIATLSPTYGAVFCHKLSHINGDECGAVEFHTGGAKLIPLEGVGGKITPDELEASIETFFIGEPHHIQPAMASIANTTEAGTVYTPDEVHALSQVLKKHNLKFHMDGARFANAIAEIGCSPAQMTWQAGIDALSFGTTKNGTMGAEAAIFFDDGDDGSFVYRRMRSGHLVSKMRFVSAQIIAYLEDDLWLNNATHANAMADKLYRGVKDAKDINFTYPVRSNVMFVEMSKPLNAALEQAGFIYYTLPAGDNVSARLVSAFNTDEAVIDDFIKIVNNF